MHFHQRKRREFITLLGGAAAAWPLAARAQQAGKPRPRSASSALWASVWRPVGVRLLCRDWANLAGARIATFRIEYRWAEGRPERVAEIAAEFVRLKVDIIVTVASAVPTVVKATSTIPIVFAMGSDPVRGGLVACRDRAATSLDYPKIKAPISPANGWNSCVKFVPICAGWWLWPRP